MGTGDGLWERLREALRTLDGVVKDVIPVVNTLRDLMLAIGGLLTVILYIWIRLNG